MSLVITCTTYQLGWVVSITGVGPLPDGTTWRKSYRSAMPDWGDLPLTRPDLAVFLAKAKPMAHADYERACSACAAIKGGAA